MRISSKCRYAIAAMISMASNENNNEQVTILSISDKLGISKIYLEQVFSLLKRAGLVVSLKGSQGGYLLSRDAGQITIYEIMNAVETSLFEKAARCVSDRAEYIDDAIQSLVFDRLDDAVKDKLSEVTLYNLVQEAKKHNKNRNFMFYI